ncbi:hypothetical protein [Pseudooceanicola atlanticus]|uniref:hypothetical protein n=1 Tax=Pseudooceanicola atlanticus TaxID=1461694 RepID=UPI000693FDEB|nr:hypothetical protein [Pseudooceanicola atlanticus]
MPGPLRHLWRHHPIALSLFAAAALAALVLAVRLTLFTAYWADPEHRRQHPEPWMTPGYVAHSWHLPPDMVLRQIGLDQPPKKHRSLKDIADDLGVPADVLIADLAAFLAEQSQSGQAPNTHAPTEEPPTEQAPSE